MAIDDFDTSHNRQCENCFRYGFDEGDWQFIGYDDMHEMYICPDCQSYYSQYEDDLLDRAAQQRTGADGAVAEESPNNLRTKDSDAGAMGATG